MAEHVAPDDEEKYEVVNLAIHFGKCTWFAQEGAAQTLSHKGHENIELNEYAMP